MIIIFYHEMLGFGPLLYPMTLNRADVYQGAMS